MTSKICLLFYTWYVEAKKWLWTFVKHYSMGLF